MNNLQELSSGGVGYVYEYEVERREKISKQSKF
jgi:hypothetical protein